MRKVLTFLIALVFVTSTAFCWDTYVHGYYRRDGTYVAPHWRSSPDGNFWNNWSTKGNINPYTGRPGTRWYHYYNYNTGRSGTIYRQRLGNHYYYYHYGN